jgi:N-acetylmuramoyl-L-alanine amidase
VGPCITKRAAIGNRAAAAGRGARVVAVARRGTTVRDALRAGTGEPSSYTGHHVGVTVRTDLGGLDLSTIPKVFIECGNMRNSVDAARLSSGAWRARAAAALARGLASYFAS